jgi:hypothetical protein
MNGIDNFEEQLTQAIQIKLERLESKELSQLKEEYRLLYSSFQGIYNVLLRKSLISEDPYKYEQKISDITVPSSKKISENERHTQMTQRLSEYDTQLDFLINYYQFTIDYLNLKRIKKIISLTKYIQWDAITENSTDPTTQAFALYLIKTRQSADNLSTGILNENLTVAERSYKNALKLLKELADFQKEYYKYKIRTLVLKDLSIDWNNPPTKEELSSKIKQGIAKKTDGMAFYRELIEEIFEENKPENENGREAVLKSLEVEASKPKKKKPKISYTDFLMNGIKILSNAGRTVIECTAKLKDNAEVLDAKKISISERLKKWLERVINKEEKKRIYDVEIFDTTTSSSKTERVVFDTFAENAEKKGRTLAAITSKTGTAMKKLQGASEEQLFNFLSRNISELQVFHRQMQALDTFFKSEVDREDRNKLRGIKIELTTLKNHIVNANKVKHEYVAKREELSQFEKLGIDSETEA